VTESNQHSTVLQVSIAQTHLHLHSHPFPLAINFIYEQLPSPQVLNITLPARRTTL